MKLYKIPIYLYQIITRKRTLKIFLEKNTEPIVEEDAENIFFYKKIECASPNTNIFSKLISIDGIAGFAGSSAITDFLGEFSNCTSIGGVDIRENPDRGIDNSYECDFFRDAYGVYELEKICYFDDDRIQDEAIRAFIKKVITNYKSYISFYNDFYLDESRKFINDILDFRFEWTGNFQNYFVKKLSVNEYREKAKKYIYNLISNIPSKEYLILDNLASITNPKQDVLKDYFGDVKILASYRDPRDLFTAARNLSGNDWVPKDPIIFVKWYKWYFERFNYNNNSNVLLIRFEDFVFKYEEISLKIRNFINLDEGNHDLKFKFFNPDISKNNIGIYKNYHDQNAIKCIEENLSDYIYRG